MVRPVFKYPIRFADNPYGGVSDSQRLNITYAGVNQTVTVIQSDSREMYWCTADAQTGSHITDVAALLESAVEGAFAAQDCVFNVSVDTATQKLVVSGAHPFELHWDDADTTLEGPTYGFHQVDTQEAQVLTSSFVCGGTWFPTRQPFPDSYDVPVVLNETVRCKHSGRQRTFSFNDGRISNRTMEFRYEYRGNVITEVSTVGPSGTFQEFFEQALVIGVPIRYYTSSADVSDPDGYAIYKSADQDPTWDIDSNNSTFYTTKVRLMSATDGED